MGLLLHMVFITEIKKQEPRNTNHSKSTKMCTHVCKVANGFTMPLHQNVKSCLPQLLVSLNRLKAATTQLGRGKEKERERDRERATGDMVAIVTIWWV